MLSYSQLKYHIFSACDILRRDSVFEERHLEFMPFLRSILGTTQIMT